MGARLPSAPPPAPSGADWRNAFSQPALPAVSSCTHVHVVSRLCDEVLATLLRTFHSASVHGIQSCVVCIDRNEHRAALLQLDASMEIFLVPPARNPLSQWRAIAGTLRALQRARAPLVMHMHGWMPSLMGALALNPLQSGVPMYFSAQGSIWLKALHKAGNHAQALLERVPVIARHVAVACVPPQTSALKVWNMVAPKPPLGVTQALAGGSRQEAARPLIVGGGLLHSVSEIELFCQLAVVLDGADPKPDLAWMGSVAPTSARMLHAAGVRTVAHTAQDRALHLCGGWLYVACAADGALPLSLLGAMSAGMPCVAMNSAAHRDVVVDGETGFLCDTVQELAFWIDRLLCDHALRQRMGQAARDHAATRFRAESMNKRLAAARPLSGIDQAAARSL